MQDKSEVASSGCVGWRCVGVGNGVFLYVNACTLASFVTKLPYLIRMWCGGAHSPSGTADIIWFHEGFYWLKLVGNHLTSGVWAYVLSVFV